MTAEHLTTLYTGLAKLLTPPTLAPLPDWVAAPGCEWPIFESVTRLAGQNPSVAEWQQAVQALMDLPAAAYYTRCTEYETLFIGLKQAPIWLYESYHVSGRIIGPTTFQVKKLYEKAGVMLNSAELPDHAALEISFLAYLAEQESLSGADAEDWRAVREAFVEKHAGRWLPTIGGQLLRSPYPAWAAVGYILDACFAEEKPIPKICPVQTGSPMIIRAEDCTLCGFCVQTCPEKALKIHEDEHTTALWLLAEHCTQCRKCGQVCDQKALSYEIRKLPAAALLRQSHRATCPACSAQTVSQAEINAIATRLGEHPRWLDYCLDCRPKLLEMN